MDIRKLQRAIVDGLEDVKAQHVVVFNTEHLSPLFERVIIATGASNRQTKSLAASVRDTVRSRQLQVLRTEGEENGEWIIVDCGAAVVHIMQPVIREYYHLEEIWGGKPVKMKLGDAQPARLVKASEDGPGAGEPASAAVSARYLAAKRKPSGKPPAKSARRAGAKRPATTEAAPARSRTGAGAGTARKTSPSRPAAPARKAAPSGIAAPSRKASPSPKRAPASKAAPSRKTAPGKKATAPKRRA